MQQEKERKRETIEFENALFWSCSPFLLPGKGVLTSGFMPTKKRPLRSVIGDWWFTFDEVVHSTP